MVPANAQTLQLPSTMFSRTRNGKYNFGGRTALERTQLLPYVSEGAFVVCQ